MTETPNKRLKTFIQSIKLPQYKLAQLLGTNPTQVNRFLKDGYEIKDSDVLDTLESLGMNRVWYRTGIGEMFNNKKENLFEQNITIQPNVKLGSLEELDITTFKAKLSQVTVPVNSGATSQFTNPYAEVEFTMELPQDAKCFTMIGDSMSPVIPDGFVAIVDARIKLSTDNIVLLQVNNEFICGKVKELNDDKIVLSAENKGFPSSEIAAGQYEYVGTLYTVIRKYY